MADVDLEIGGEVNCDGNVVLTTPELEDGQIAAANVVDDANGENSQLVQKHANPTSDRLLGNDNDVDGENGGKSQLDPEHAKQTYDISKLLKIYAVSQAGILAGTRRGGWKWIPLMLSGLVSTAAIVVVLQQKGYRTWDAKKIAVVVMLLAVSVCLLLSFIP